MRTLAAGLLALLLSPLAPSARAATEYSVLDGLSQNSVLAMVRDAEGFLWLGTEDGLNRFDGNEFRVYRPGAIGPRAQAAGYIRAMAGAGQHLFMASNGGGLAIFDRASAGFRILGVADGLPTEHLTSVALAGPGLLYVGSRNGLARLRWDGDPMQAAMRIESLAPGESAQVEIWELHAGPSGLWIGSGDGVFRVDAAGALEAVHVPQQPAGFNIDALLEFPAGVLWVGSWGHGLFRLDLGSGQIRRFLPGQPDTPGLRSARILDLEAGPEGMVFVGTDRGVAWFEPDCDCLRSLDPPRSARMAGRGFLAVSLLADASGGLFAGFWGEGLVRFTPTDRAFHVERLRDESPPGLAHNRVRALLEDRAGHLWVGSFGGGVQRVQAGRREHGRPWPFESFSLPPGAPDEARLVWSLLEDREGRIWAGTDDGMYRLDPGQRSWQRELPPDSPVPMAGVRALLEDAAGRIWVGSSSGLGRIDRPDRARRRIDFLADQADSPFRSQDQSIHALHRDLDGRLWLGSSGGLHVLDAEGRHLAGYRVEAGLPGPIVSGIHRSGDGSLWLATSGGLARVDESAGLGALRFENVSETAGLPRGASLGAVSDRFGDLWVAGTRGLLRYDPSDRTHRVWTRAHGTASDEFASNALAVGRNGWLYFGGIDGLTAVDPRRLRERLEQPRPVIASAEMAGQSLHPDSAEPLSLRHNHAPLILDFSALVFDAPDVVRFRYRLDPDAGFIDLGARRSLILDRLPPGQHRLELEADNQGQRGSRSLLQIEVVPPPYATWSFRLVAGAAALLLLGLLYLWRVRELTRQRRLLESLVGERTRELRAQKEALEATAEALVVANDKLKSLSTHDALTDLPNRRGLIELMEAAEADRTDRPAHALALIDLDHFKRINDAHGHLVGDAVLRDFGALAAAQSGADVIVGRWGGEEFLALLPSLEPEAARRWAERLLGNVRERRVVQGGTSIGYRISIGIALPRPGDDTDRLIARADDALYAAKAGGRDRVVVHD